MPVLTPQQRTSYGSTIEGVVGHFATSAGEVIFLQTRARLSVADTSNAGRLTGLLTPAREALEVGQMDFNQLLQRDLDDHRIAHELVPYILRKQYQGPAFFPPILAALLPFEARKPKTELPAMVRTPGATDPAYSGVTWNMSTAGDVFQLQILCDAAGQPDSVGQAVLRWNDERAKLIIMDGQHRAMALLAIHRTLTNTWSAAAAASERYKPFYESRVRELLKEAQTNGVPAESQPLEFPVTICLFPEFTGPGLNPHNAARKLFVDVNKEAKPPSESRLILLSDARLSHVLARELLNQLRKSCWDTKFPLYAVEYDNPEPRTSQPRRWNAVTNLEILLRSVEFCCFGPGDLVKDVESLTKAKQGRPDKGKMNSYFRSQMRFQDVLEDTIVDGPRTLDRQELGLELFPVYNQKARALLHERFYDSWGKGILRLFSEVEPYKQHIAAARSIENSWGPNGEVTGALAREALFEGVGMFWTLEQGHEHWKEEVSRARTLRTTIPGPSDISRAWQIVDVTKRGEFEKERARLYLGRNDEKHTKSSNEFYEAAITYAAQVGLALTWAVLREENQTADPRVILDAVISGLNRSLSTGPVSSRDRRLILSKKESDAFNQLPRMDASFAAYFRVFWLELLLMEPNQQELRDAGVDLDGAKALLQKGRSFYLKAVAGNLTKIQKDQHRDWSFERCAKAGRESAVHSMARAYNKWFGRGIDTWHEDLEALLADSDNVEESESTEENVEDPESSVDLPNQI